MKLSLKTKMALFWCTSVLSASIGLSGFALLSVTEDPAALFRFIQTYRLIHREYFREISDTALLDGAAQGMVASLEDPHSQLLLGAGFESFLTQTKGEYSGIGVVIGKDAEGALRALAIFPESPAEKAGVLPGDTLLSVDGRPAADMEVTDAAELIRGEAGTEVRLVLSRGGEEIEKTVTRSQVNMPTVQANMLEGNIGYIHIFSFTPHTPQEFSKEYDALLAQGMEKLVLDVRMNPGGVIDSVVAVADKILSGGTVVSYQDKDGHTKNYTVKGTDRVLPMAVLIDHGSASASEILAGAVQDKKEGVILGETSYGKGTVQNVILMDGREALKLSIAQYLTAAGRKIDKVGITPDIAVPQEGRAFDRATDSVLARAVEELKKQ